MGLNVVTDLRIFQETCNEIKNNESLVQDACSRSLSEAERKLEETQQELAHSNQLLQEAIAEEQYRLAIMRECEAEVQAAAAGLPETAAWYADAQRRLAIAIAEYEKAKAHRILMEQRVALAEQCVSMASEMVETLIAKYNYGKNQISHFSSEGINRLSHADRATSEYVSENVNVSSANVTTSQNNNKAQNKSYCENLGNEVVCLGSVPGQQEALAGRPFIGQSGKNLETILSNLKYKGETLSRNKVSIDNSWDSPLWMSKHGKTEASLEEICSEGNLARLNKEIGKNTKIVIAFGDNAYTAATSLKAKYNLNYAIIKTDHPSMSHINRTYKSVKVTPEERNLDRLMQMSNEIKKNSNGLFS